MICNVAYVLYNKSYQHISRTTYYFIVESTTIIKIYFDYYNHCRIRINITITDNTPLILSCAKAEKIYILHLTLKGLLISLRLIIHLCIPHLLLIVSYSFWLMLWIRIGVFKYFINILHLYYIFI